MISADELAALVAHIEGLEATVANQAARIDFLLRERVFHKEGKQGLEVYSAALKQSGLGFSTDGCCDSVGLTLRWDGSWRVAPG